MPSSMDRDREALLRAYDDPRLEDARACPFCGGKSLAIFPGPNKTIFGKRTTRITCTTCFSQGPVGVSVEHAIVRWNGAFEGRFQRIDK